MPHAAVAAGPSSLRSSISRLLIGAAAVLLLNACGPVDPTNPAANAQTLATRAEEIRQDTEGYVRSLPAAPEQKAIRVLSDAGAAGMELVKRPAIVVESARAVIDTVEDTQQQLEDGAAAIEDRLRELGDSKR